MSDIPGAYPSTPDETPATHRLRHPGVSNIGAAQHEHHEQNKLQKAQDPRSHKHVDSGVGMFDSEPSYASTQPMSEYKPAELPNDLAGPSDSQKYSHAPSDPTTTTTTTNSLLTTPLPAPTTAIDSLPTAPTSAPQDNSSYNSAPQPVGNDSHVQNNRDISAPQPGGSDAHAQHHDQAQPTKDVTTPYWGNLPKAMSGGIYNTVMGHGSAAEDHSQHNHLAQKSAESRAHVGDDTVDIPKGGVYNTVTGHGSHDEETTRRSMAPTGTSSGGDSTALGREQHHGTGVLGMGAAAAPMMGQRLSQQAEPSEPTSSTARGMAASQQAMSSAGAPASATPNTVRGTDQVRSTSPRAFPLSTSRQDARRLSADDAHINHGYIAPAAAAGAGAAAAGAAAHTDKPKKLQKQRDTSEEARRRSMGQSPERRTHQTEGPVTTVEGPSSSSKRRSTRANSDSTSPASTERKKHGFLGIFHRHKDDKEKEKIVTKEPKADDSHHHDHHRKQEAVAGAAAGAGAYGLAKHHKDDKKEHSDPMETKQDPYAPARSTVNGPSAGANDHATAHHAQPSAAYGALPPTIDENSARRQPSATDSVPIPPARSEKRRSASPTTMAAMTGATAQQPHDSARHTHGSAPRYAPGVAAGLGASVMAGQHRSSAPHTQPDSTSNFTSPATPFEHPRAPPSTPFDSNLAAASKTSKSARTPSPKARDASALSRTPPQANATAGSSDETHYNVLSSGTPSGVKVGSRSSRGSTGSASAMADHGAADLNQKDRHHKMLASGMAAGAATGLAAGYAHQKHDASRDLNEPSRNSMLNPSTTQDQHHDTQSTKPGSSMLPMPIRSKQPLESVSEPTAYPSPEQAKGMSPEVMPDAYTAPTAQPTTSRFSEQSAPQASGSREAQHSLHHSAGNPALAAAAGAWASNAGPSSGNASAPSAGKMMHKCQHCGGDNDISQDVAEMMKRMTSH